MSNHATQTGYSFKQGKTKAAAPFFNRVSKKSVELPKGTFVRVYKGTPGGLKAAGFPVSPESSGGLKRWLVETAPSNGNAWLVYTEDEGIPASYDSTWDQKSLLAPGWKRLYRCQWIP